MLSIFKTKTLTNNLKHKIYFHLYITLKYFFKLKTKNTFPNTLTNLFLSIISIECASTCEQLLKLDNGHKNIREWDCKRGNLIHQNQRTKKTNLSFMWFWRGMSNMINKEMLVTALPALKFPSNTSKEGQLCYIPKTQFRMVKFTTKSNCFKEIQLQIDQNRHKTFFFDKDQATPQVQSTKL